jgi:hypothetical protein
MISESPLLRLDRVEFADDTRPREVAGVAVSRWTFWLASGVAPQPERFVSSRPLCEQCAGTMHFIDISDRTGRVVAGRLLPDHATEYLDNE